ncbi:MAG: GAF domain-containing protein [Nitrospirota bacterium]|nr:GAF domain-containing protein [Nitrospirota bacterium]
MEKENSNFKKADEFLQMFKRGEEFTKALLKDNEKLRYNIVQLEEQLQRAGNEERIKLFEERITQLEQELSSYHERFREVEAENRDFALKYLEVEEENNNLANLYVASYQLHSTLDFSEVLRVVLEIVINLIGAREFTIFLIDEKTDDLLPVAAEGLETSSVPRVRIGQGTIGTVAREGESFFSENITEAKEVNLNDPIVCIPLKIKDHIIGVISIYTLLTQKAGFTSIDYELFNLLAGHAATAIYSSRLYTQSERKLTTLQSFLDLLKEKTVR